MKILCFWLIYAGFMVVTVLANREEQNPTRNLIFVYDKIDPVVSFDEFVSNTYRVLDYYQNFNIFKKYSIVFATQTDVLVREIPYQRDYSIFKSKMNEIKEEKRIESPMKALLEALRTSSSNSLIFVFTIAHPEHSSVLGDILELIEIKKIEVGFFLEWSHFSEGIPEEYQKISFVGNGIIVDKISTVFEFMLHSLHSYPRKVNLLTVNSNKTNKYSISIDTFVNSEIVLATPKTYYADQHVFGSFAGSESKIEIIRPKTTSGETIYVNISSRGYSYESGAYFVRIFGYSDINFYHGFATIRANSIQDTSPRPTLDVPNYIYVQPTTLSYQPQLQYCEIIAPNGDIVQKILLHRVNQTDLYYGLFEPSLRIHFYLRITAIIHGQPVQRMSSNGISSVEQFVEERKQFCSTFKECLIWYALFSATIIISVIIIVIISCARSTIVKYRYARRRQRSEH